MVPPLTFALAMSDILYFSANARLAIQPSIGRVIPDVLLTDGGAAWETLGAERLTCHEAAVLAEVERGPRSLRQLEAALYLAGRQLQRCLQRLVRAGLLAWTSADCVALTAYAAQTAAVEIIAIEVKLRRWREALAQAVAYRSFADRAYVVLDATRISVAGPLCSEFLDAGVGLILQCGVELRCVLSAPTVRPRAGERWLALARAARAPLLREATPSGSHRAAILAT